MPKNTELEVGMRVKLHVPEGCYRYGKLVEKCGAKWVIRMGEGYYFTLYPCDIEIDAQDDEEDVTVKRVKVNTGKIIYSDISDIEITGRVFNQWAEIPIGTYITDGTNKISVGIKTDAGHIFSLFSNVNWQHASYTDDWQGTLEVRSFNAKKRICSNEK